MASIREMALTARKAGLRHFGISDHLVLYPYRDSGPGDWSMPPALFPDYVAEVLQVKRELDCEDFRVLLGVEADFFPETFPFLQKLLRRYPMDYVIGTTHYAGGFPIDHSREAWATLSKGQCNRVWERYFANVEACCEARYCQFLAHFDLPKIYGCRMPEGLRPLRTALLRKIREAGLALEVNTAGFDKPCGESYPSGEILLECKELEIPLLLSADAHSPAQLLRHFERAREGLLALGVRQLACFENGRMQFTPL